MSDFQGLSNTQLVQTINDEAFKKGLNPEKVFSAVEESLRIAGKEKYGNSKLKVRIDRKSGAISVLKEIIVVDDSVNSRYIYSDDLEEKHLYEALRISEAVSRYPNESLEIGSVVLEVLPNVDFSRLAIRSAVQTIFQLIKKLEQEEQYKKYKNRVGEIVIGFARRVSKEGGVVVDLGDAEAYLPAKNTIKGDLFKQGDRVKAIISSVTNEDKGHQIILSRTSNSFVGELFRQEVPEIYDGIIEIKAIAREPGSKAKVAVHSSDQNIDPVGACVGIRGGRIRSIIDELNGEKIDIVIHSSNLADFAINSITPAKAIQAIIDEQRRCIEIIVEQDFVSLAIGKKGQNVRLASELVGCKLDILSEGDASKKRLEEFSTNTEVLVAALNVEEIIAQLLITEGFDSVQDVASADVTKLSTIEGFDINIAEELLKRAQEYVLKEKISYMNSDLHSLPELSDDEVSLLCNNGIKGLESLAELSREEFKDIIGEHVFTEAKIGEIIISARRKLKWFEE